VKEFSLAFGDEILLRFAVVAFVATVSSTTTLLLSSFRLLES
jgi:hypothetical protein